MPSETCTAPFHQNIASPWTTPATRFSAQCAVFQWYTNPPVKRKATTSRSKRLARGVASIWASQCPSREAPRRNGIRRMGTPGNGLEGAEPAGSGQEPIGGGEARSGGMITGPRKGCQRGIGRSQEGAPPVVGTGRKTQAQARAQARAREDNPLPVPVPVPVPDSSGLRTSRGTPDAGHRLDIPRVWEHKSAHRLGTSGISSGPHPLG